MNKFEYKNLTPFKWFVLENFPFIEADFDALTEWQLFCKLGKEINKIIDSQNVVGTEMEKFSKAFIELQNYVNNYFDNLDVQDEINNKLNSLVEDGTLTQLIGNYIQPLIDAQNEKITQQNQLLDNYGNSINTLDSRINNIITENNPTEGNTELIDIRVSENGNIYASAGSSVRNQIKNVLNINDITYKTLNKGVYESNLIIPTELFEKGGINSSNGNNTLYENGIRTKGFLTFTEIMKYLYITSTVTSPNNNVILYAYDLNGKYLEFYEFMNKVPFQNLSNFKKYRLVLIDSSAVTSIQNTLNKFTFKIVSKIKRNNEIYDIEQLNLIKSQYTVPDAVISTTTGNIVHAPGQYSATIVEVEPNTQYYCDDAGFYQAFFDETHTLIGSVHYYGNNNSLSSPFTTPSNARYLATVKITSKIGVSAFLSKQNKYYNENDISISKKNNVINENIKPNNVLYNKLISCFGDSITSVNYTLPNWWQIIEANTGCQCIDYGISGTTLAHTNDRHLYNYNFTRLDANEIGYVEDEPSTWATGNCFCERFSKVNTNSDAIVIMGGTNDTNVPLGNWNDTETNTFYGALNHLFTNILNRLAGKKIIICTPIQTSNSYLTNVIDAKSVLKNSNASNPVSLQIRAEAIKEKCKQFGLPCIDLYNDSGINGVDTNKIYYRSGDTLHPSSYGQIRLASLIQNELEKLFTD